MGPDLVEIRMHVGGLLGYRGGPNGFRTNARVLFGLRDAVSRVVRSLRRSRRNANARTCKHARDGT